LLIASVGGTDHRGDLASIRHTDQTLARACFGPDFGQVLARFWRSLQSNPSAGFNSSLCYARDLWLHNLPLVYNVWFCSTVRFLPCCPNLLVDSIHAAPTTSSSTSSDFCSRSEPGLLLYSTVSTSTINDPLVDKRPPRETILRVKSIPTLFFFSIAVTVMLHQSASASLYPTFNSSRLENGWFIRTRKQQWDITEHEFQFSLGDRRICDSNSNYVPLASRD